MLRKISADPIFLRGVQTAVFCTFVLTVLSGCGGGSGSGGPVVSFPTATFTGPLSSMTEPETFDATAATIESCSPASCTVVTTSAIFQRSSTHQITIDPVAYTVDINSGTIDLSFNDVNFIGGPSTPDPLRPSIDSFSELEGISTTERLTLLFPNVAPDFFDWASYGVWSVTNGVPPGNVFFDGGALSFGVLTPLNSVPKSGSASYNGFMDGLYVNDIRETFSLSGAASMTANFGTGNIAGQFNSIDAVLLGAAPPGVPFGNIDFTATITGNNFSGIGTATSTGLFPVPGPTLNGDVLGSFYGPTAQEAGGVFRIENVGGTEHAIGGFAVRKP